MPETNGSEEIELSGKVTYIIYQNEKNFYTVARFLTYDAEKITITGCLPGIQNDTLYHLKGMYVEHPTYGLQFHVNSFEHPLPSEEEGIVRYLSGPQFPGIGVKTVEKIVDALGEDCLNAIREDPGILKTLPFLKEKQADVIAAGVKKEDGGMEELVRFLNVHGIGMQNLARLNKAYGKEALNKLKENPYRVIEEIDGFGFVTADKMAKALGFSDDDPRRLYAFLISEVSDLCMKNGDSFVKKENLRSEFEKKTGQSDEVFEELMDKADLRHSLIQEENRVYPPAQYNAEMEIAGFLKDFPYEKLKNPDLDLAHEYLEEMEKKEGITYDDIQVKAVDCFLENPFMIITGGPGTGKTTIVKAFVTLFHKLYPESEIVCAAPTGRAAKRLSELTDSSAATIHSLLLWDMETNEFGRSENDPISADLLIIDEFSMVDSYLFAALLKASRRVRKICLIGDEDQLPSVGPGSVLRDLIAADRFPLIRLEHIYRQKSISEVISLSHDIRNGRVNFDQYQKDVRFFECGVSQVKATVLKIVQSALDRGYSLDDIQVLSPMYGGAAGIDVLNNALQECFNPPSEDKKELHRGYMTFREGDRVLQLKNQPEDEIYNGDVGTLVEITDGRHTEDHKTSVIVNFQNNFIEYKPETMNNITLAYCISVHKAQGSEYPIVIFPVVPQHAIMLQRKLIYTAVTRARKSLILLGSKASFEKGISQVERHPRETTLTERLKQSRNEPSLH